MVAFCGPWRLHGALARPACSMHMCWGGWEAHHTPAAHRRPPRPLAATELADEVASLPSALQSEFPDLAIDWLHTVFPYGHGSAVPRWAGRGAQAGVARPGRGAGRCAGLPANAQPAPHIPAELPGPFLPVPMLLEQHFQCCNHRALGVAPTEHRPLPLRCPCRLDAASRLKLPAPPEPSGGGLPSQEQLAQVSTRLAQLALEADHLEATACPALSSYEELWVCSSSSGGPGCAPAVSPPAAAGHPQQQRAPPPPRLPLARCRRCSRVVLAPAAARHAEQCRGRPPSRAGGGAGGAAGAGAGGAGSQQRDGSLSLSDDDAGPSTSRATSRGTKGGGGGSKRKRPAGAGGAAAKSKLSKGSGGRAGHRGPAATPDLSDGECEPQLGCTIHVLVLGMQGGCIHGWGAQPLDRGPAAGAGAVWKVQRACMHTRLGHPVTSA